ncbi:hypothetical protein AAVH_11086 [Aphelenchoides avenae]|nr:hypothetical protein AAVH_11086 [Aphelenchus avenae]
MSTKSNVSTGRIYGRVEREANGTVIFVSEQGRRIRFRYTGKYQASLQYPDAAEYQCTQCPVKALMINANFPVVDQCAGHDCSVDAGHPQWTPPTADAKKTVSAQLTPVQPTVIAKATYDEDGCITWPSERYPDCLEACGISRRCLKVLGDNIVERHPDDVGTNHGHLCQLPLLQ